MYSTPAKYLFLVPMGFIKNRLGIMVFVYIFIVEIGLLQIRGDELNAVVVIFRHGERTPTEPYPNDPYQNRSFWPVGFGQLTNRGKEEEFHLGQWLRSRYGGFLPENYSEEDVYIMSTDVDRTLMSAEVNLAGLYPPTDAELWTPDIKWQPIPVHTTPENIDAILSAKKPCLQYQMLYNELHESDYFRTINYQNRELFDYLTENSGCVVSNMGTVQFLYDTLLIETLFNFTLPPWAAKVFPDKLIPLASLTFAMETFTPEMARLKTGPLFDYIINFFSKRISNPSNSLKLLILSAHDKTIANVLNSMGAFEYHCPPFSSTILFELNKRIDGDDYINIFYKNTSIPRRINLKNCNFDCKYVDFVNILKPITVDLDQWELECNIQSAFAQSSTFQWSIVLICFLIGIILLLLAVIVCIGIKKKCHSNYIRLPN